MSEYPLRGNGIEIRKKKDNGDDKYEIRVDSQLQAIMLQEDKWKEAGKRKKIEYKRDGDEIVWAPTDTPCT